MAMYAMSQKVYHNSETIASSPTLDGYLENNESQHSYNVMSVISGNRYAMENCLLAVVFLALLTLADSILTNALPVALGSVPPQVPGFWNLTTTALVLSTVSAAYHYGSRLTSSLVSVFWRADGHAWIPVVTGIFKIIGGGSHATAFLTITLIRKCPSGSLRLQRNGEPNERSSMCKQSFSTTAPLTCSDKPRSPLGDAMGTLQDTLQEMEYQAIYDQKSVEVTRLNILLGGCRESYSAFIHYVYSTSSRRDPRIVMSLVIFIVVLPLVVIVLAKYTSSSPNAINLMTAEVGVILLTTGALLIGLAQTKPVLISGLVINTLGVATDLALLAFAADVVTEDLASCFFMTIASLESAGTLVGIGLLYPLYQLGLYDDTLFGGIPYYICAGLFTIAGVRVWQMKPLITW
ncbi:hypothetical protein CHU98_g2666 [Xylaria longipes]|nr:hypothetical protein CHU98_g2666 [Xylaria longipes]